MAKKFEEAHPTPETIVNGFQLLGIANLLGKPGPNTMAEFSRHITESEVELFCLPGNFSSLEVLSLFKDAGLLAA